MTEAAPALVGSGPSCEALTIAERYARDRAELKSHDSEVRKAAAVRLVESGSSAVYPLLRVVAEDKCMEVRKAAIWSLLRLTDDMLGGKSEERDSPSALLSGGHVTDPYLRVGLEAVIAQSTGGSPAYAAYRWAYYLDPKSRGAGERFLTDLVRKAPDLDPELPTVLERMARRHMLPRFRRSGAELLADYEEWRSTGTLPQGGRLAQWVDKRRETALEGSEASETALDHLVVAASSDPDRAVRHIAGVNLYCRVAKGAVVRTPTGLPFKDREVRYLFLEGHDTLRIHPAPAKSLKRVADASPRSRQCALRLLVHLRPRVGGIVGAHLDELARESMRDKDREVRRDATVVAKVSSTDYTQAELACRLRDHLSGSPMYSLPVYLGTVFAAYAVSFIYLEIWWVTILPIFVQMALLTNMLWKSDSRRPGITPEECLETLSAMEPLADSAPERLRESLPELRKLSGPGIFEPRVRAKARELLAKVSKATIETLPIAAASPAVEPEALPIPGAAPEVREVVAR